MTNLQTLLRRAFVYRPATLSILISARRQAVKGKIFSGVWSRQIDGLTNEGGRVLAIIDETGYRTATQPTGWKNACDRASRHNAKLSGGTQVSDYWTNRNS